MWIITRILSKLKSTVMDLPNFTYIGEGFYVVRTQAGFKQAVKHFRGPNSSTDVEGHPTSYPAVVALSIGYRGYNYVQSSCLHVNEFRKGLDRADPQ